MQTLRRRLWHTTREYVTHWSVASAILALTGAAPEHWFADLAHALPLPLPLEALPPWLAHVDYRLVAVIVGLSLIVGNNLWRHHGHPAPATVEAAVPVTLAASVPAATALALPDKPSLVALPFENMSGDLEQEYFVDGLVEDITTALSRISSLFVIARNSAFTYKGRAVDVRQAGRELGVRYVLEGGVRKAGDKVRITGQLIEAATGHHLWADRFDGDMSDVFELQDRITESVAGAIEPSVQRAEMVRAMAKSTDNLDAYDLYFRALHEYYKMTHPSLDAAMALLRRALAADPNWALAKGFPARIYTVSDSLGWVDAADKGIPVALAREVIASGSDDPAALRGAGHAMSHFGQDYPAALATLDRTLRLQPNSAQVFEALGWVHCHAADPAPAVGYFQRALRLSPLDLEIGVTLSGLGAALLMLGQTEEAYAPLRRAAEELPTWSGGHRWLILACVRLGRLDEARAVATRMMQYIPGIRVPTASQFSNRVLVEEYRQAQRLAGIPD